MLNDVVAPIHAVQAHATVYAQDQALHLFARFAAQQAAALNATLIAVVVPGHRRISFEEGVQVFRYSGVRCSGTKLQSLLRSIERVTLALS